MMNLFSRPVWQQYDDRTKEIPYLKVLLLQLVNTCEKWCEMRREPSERSQLWPNFMIIGAQKSGTTWLRENLNCHPEIFLPNTEPHYFDLFYHQKLDSYLNLYSQGSGAVKGDSTPKYSILPKRRIRTIRQFMPTVKIILILRNPIDRAWSNAKMRFFQQLGQDPSEISDGEFYRHFDSQGSIARGSYSQILDNWESLFPKQQILVLFYDDVSKRPKELLQSVFQFLSVSAVVDWSSFPYERKTRPGKVLPLPEPYRQFLTSKYADEINRLAVRFGSKVRSWQSSNKTKTSININDSQL